MSKFLSYVLRHGPGDFGLTLDHGGWVEVDALLKAIGMTLIELEEIVTTDEKGRYSIVDGRIRANQGHSVPVDLGLVPCEPPEYLYHGTYGKAWASIRLHGIQKMERHHVHLSEDLETAKSVASRRSGPTEILRVSAGRMHQEGHVFYRSTNGVWLTEHVHTAFIALVPK